VGVADFLDSRTMALRWLVAWFRNIHRIGDDAEEVWSFWMDGAAAPSSCVLAHCAASATTYLGAAPEADFATVEILLEDEFLPERLVTDSMALDAWLRSAGNVARRADQTLGLEILAWGSRGSGDEPRHPGFRRAIARDLDLLVDFDRYFQTELGLDVPTDLESLLEARLLFVLEEDGKVKGMVRSNLSDGKYVHAGGVYVHPPYRGRGVGRALAAGLGSLVREEEAATVILDAHAHRTDALKAYVAAGYERVGAGAELRWSVNAWE
jgi:GNAT superfamily N-acetyltransferase